MLYLLMLFGIIVLVLAIVGTIVFVKTRSIEFSDEGATDLVFQLEARPYFFSVAENKFFVVLEEVSRELDLRVFPKVGLNDLFKDKPGADRKQYYRYASMHVDYLLVTRKDYRPVAGIELDGPSHQSKKQKARDSKKDAVFRAAGLPLLRYMNKDNYPTQELRQRLQDMLALPASR